MGISISKYSVLLLIPLYKLDLWPLGNRYMVKRRWSDFGNFCFSIRKFHYSFSTTEVSWIAEKKTFYIFNSLLGNLNAAILDYGEGYLKQLIMIWSEDWPKLQSLFSIFFCLYSLIKAIIWLIVHGIYRLSCLALKLLGFCFIVLSLLTNQILF